MISKRQKRITAKLYYMATNLKASFHTICDRAGFDERDVTKFILWKIDSRLRERIKFNEKRRIRRT